MSSLLYTGQSDFLDHAGKSACVFPKFCILPLNHFYIYNKKAGDESGKIKGTIRSRGTEVSECDQSM